MDTPNLIYYSIPIFAVAMGTEYLLSREQGMKLYTKKDFLSNMAFASGGVILGSLATGYYMTFYYLCYHAFEPFRESVFGFSSLGWGWKIWMIGIVADDFTYYWFHRSSHTVRLFWACHVVHHSSDLFNLSTAVRNGWLSYTYKPLFWVWMAFVGFHPVMVLTCLAITNSYGFFCHTLMLPWWDKWSAFLVTPGLHAVHHGQEGRSIDKNFAGVFILYDRIFGSYEPITPAQKVIFGVTRPPRSQNFIEIMTHEFRDLYTCMKTSRSWKVRLMYLLKRPGWTPGKNES